MRSFILATFALFIVGCTGQSLKNCGNDYEGCLLPAERSCTPAEGKYIDGDLTIYEKINGGGDLCAIEFSFESPPAAARLGNNYCTVNKGDDISTYEKVCKYCYGDAINFLKSEGLC